MNIQFFLVGNNLCLQLGCVFTLVLFLFSIHSDFACYDGNKYEDIFNGLPREQCVGINARVVVKSKFNLYCFIILRLRMI